MKLSSDALALPHKVFFSFTPGFSPVAGLRRDRQEPFQRFPKRLVSNLFLLNGTSREEGEQT